MRFSAGFFRQAYPFAFLLVLISSVFYWHSAPRAAESAKLSENRAETANYDIRTDETGKARATREKYLSEAGKTAAVVAFERKSLRLGEKNLLERSASVKIEYSEDSGVPETISPDVWQSADFLTAPSSEKRVTIFKNFLKQNSQLVGLDEAQIDRLRTTADYTNPDGNLSFVHLEQAASGVQVFRGEAKAAFTRKNELVRIVNNLAPRLDYENLATDFGSAEQAVANAAKFAPATRVFEQTAAEKIYFPVEIGVARAAWRVFLENPNEAFYVIVDARDGELLWRKSLVESQTQSATYEVYGNQTSMAKTADSPSAYTPGCLAPTNCPQPPSVTRQSFTLIGNEPPYAFNDLGWIPDGENRTIGNNAEAGIDRQAPNGIDPDGWAFGNPARNFVYAYNPAPGNPAPGGEPLPTTQTYPPSAFQQGSVTNAFYAANRWHDETYRLGFTEQARNFQADNFGRGGQGNDSIAVEVQDSSGTNGAAFTNASDGARGRLQLYIWTAPTPDRDGALDNQVIFHELTHGLSNRLHGNAAGLSGNMARGMGEGWSDFYALAMLSEPTDDPLGTYTIAGYLAYLLGGTTSNYYYGIRRFPTAIMASLGPNGRPHNPLTFKHLNPNCDTTLGTTTTAVSSAFPRNPVISTSSSVQACDQIHNAGELWSVTLWEVRHQLIERHGATEGNRRALQYVTDGMKLAPFNPTFLQARDAIVTAASASDQGDVLPIRRGFAIRGMGFYAGIQNAGTGTNTTQVTESFDVSGNAAVAGFSFTDTAGNNNGYAEPGEPVVLTISLENTSGTTITDVALQVAGGGSAVYGTIANGQTVTRTINFNVPANAICGSNHPINLNINSSAGPRSETRGILIGFPVGGPAVTFASTAPIRIPGTETGPGTADVYPSTINVSGLTGNKRIKLEITNLNATYPGDMDWLLVGPGGQKFLVMSDAVAAAATQTNAVIVLKDDAAAHLPSGSLANMTGEWKPTNYDATSDGGFVMPAPAGPYSSPFPTGPATFASVFGTNAASLNGTWSLYGVDDVSGDFATVGGWKLTFESNEFACIYCRMMCTPLRAKGDFDGDGKTDISVFRPSEGNWYLNQSAAGFGVVNWGLSGDRLAPGDYNGDGKTDFAVFRPNADASLPDFYVLSSTTFTFSAISWGLPGDVPVIEDYDGDGKADFAVFRPANHTYYVLKSNGNVLSAYSGIESGTPAAGDFDGDGIGDFATYHIDGWFVSRSSGNYATADFTRWGAAGDNPVQADYDGDGKDDLAVFRPSDQTWYILRSSNGGNIIVQWGLSADVPAPGDYDGDGKADIGVYRGGTWYIIRSTSGVLIARFGLVTDVPVPNRYLP